MPEGCAGAHSLGREGCQVGGTAWARARVWRSIDGGRPEAEVMQEEGTWAWSHLYQITLVLCSVGTERGTVFQGERGVRLDPGVSLPLATPNSP